MNRYYFAAGSTGAQSLVVWAVPVELADDFAELLADRYTNDPTIQWGNLKASEANQLRAWANDNPARKASRATSVEAAERLLWNKALAGLAGPKGRGRPAEGSKYEIRLPAEMVARLDLLAVELAVPRAEVVRRLLANALGM